MAPPDEIAKRYKTIMNIVEAFDALGGIEPGQKSVQNFQKAGVVRELEQIANEKLEELDQLKKEYDVLQEQFEAHPKHRSPP